jgi:hypothetical protein
MRVSSTEVYCIPEGMEMRQQRDSLTQWCIAVARWGLIALGVAGVALIANVILAFFSASCWMYQPHCTGAWGDQLQFIEAAGALIAGVLLLVAAPYLFTFRLLWSWESQKPNPRAWYPLAVAGGMALAGGAIVMLEVLHLVQG